MPYRGAAAYVIALLALAHVVACDPKSPTTPVSAPVGDLAPVPETPLVCPPIAAGEGVLPGTRPEHEQASYWLDVLGSRYDLDAPLLLPGDVAALDASLAARPSGHHDLLAPIDVDALLAEVDERIAWVRERLEDGRYLNADGSRVSDAFVAGFVRPAAWSPTPALRIAVGTVPVRCGPTLEPYYTASLDLRFDRNRCSALRDQEPVLVLGDWPGVGSLVRARYTMGWISPDAALSPVVPDREAAEAFVDGTRFRAATDAVAGGVPVAAETMVAARGGDPAQGLLATSDGFVEGVDLRGSGWIPAQQPVTRRAVVERAFAWLGAHYGWGGTDGGRDCSRFLMDVFSSFDLRLPRFSGLQADAGTFSIDLSEIASETDRLLLLDAAAERGVVFLHFPGHIMLYLGRDAQGTPMAIHSFAEYLVPCEDAEARAAGRTETLRTVDGVSVTTLELGRGTSRGAFIERLTRLTVIGQPPGPGLVAIAERRAPAPMHDDAQCVDADGTSLFVTPLSPNGQQAMRVIVTSDTDPGAQQIVLTDPDGRVSTPPMRFLGGPPFARVAEVDAPSIGTWRVRFGEGAVATACTEVRVRERSSRTALGTSGGSVWDVRASWDAGYEALYSAWVEALFDYPIEEDLTWTSLHELLRNGNHNLLYNHFSRDEEASLDLSPDCADLPYFLRGYFAWKMGLPWGYRTCSRGGENRPPRCESLTTNLSTREREDDVDAFERFLVNRVRNGVHSGSARTLPTDDATDWYPVTLTREHLRPGTMYADPYGHLLMVARWVPQGLHDYGVLIAADAQPDATVGRRRFWRGSFLFTPETRSVGAGFKAPRPLVMRNGVLVPMSNEALSASATFAAWGTDQYEHGQDGFYDAVEALINPRPLDAWSMQASLIDALDESVARRVNSVDNGEGFFAGGGGVIDMPSGASIFQTAGPWEDFSTPSRDMRLLISIDTVVGFADVVQRAPERFALEHVEDVDAAVDELRDQLAAELATRSFSYTRSDGSTWTLTLADLVARSQGFEMAYNPNDCPELRWGAPAGSDEVATCRRHAPEMQRARMTEYRPWFAERRRPSR